MFEIKNKKLKQGYLINKKGFSIGEAILSVFILGVTMLTILTVYSDGIKYFQDERDTVIASMLAQEGVELARNIRDNNWANRDLSTPVTPSTFDNFNASNSSNCRVDLNDSAIICSAGSLDKKIYLNAGNYYDHDNCCGAQTKFRRTITLEYGGGGLIVTSFVSWDNSDPEIALGSCTVANKCVFSQSTLTDWGTGI